MNEINKKYITGNETSDMKLMEKEYRKAKREINQLAKARDEATAGDWKRKSRHKKKPRNKRQQEQQDFLWLEQQYEYDDCTI